MTVVWIILGIVALVVVAALIIAATAPSGFRVERSIAIAAPPERIYPLIDNFHNWPQWSPFEEMDSDLKRVYEGAEAGKGAVYGWEGQKSGAGRMEIKDVTPNRHVLIDLRFLKPMKAENIAEFSLAPSNDHTTVTWAMHGPNPFIAKVMQLFFSMDKMVGAMFANGLVKMRSVAERQIQTEPTGNRNLQETNGRNGNEK